MAKNDYNENDRVNPWDLSIDNRVALLIDHYFHFFEIPEFMPRDYCKRLYLRFSQIFKIIDKNEKIRKRADKKITKFFSDDFSDFWTAQGQTLTHCTDSINDVDDNVLHLTAVVDAQDSADSARFGLILSQQENYNWQL